MLFLGYRVQFHDISWNLTLGIVLILREPDYEVTGLEKLTLVLF